MKYSDAIFKNFISLFISSTRKMWLGDADMKAHDNVRTAHWHYLSCSPKLSSCCCCLVAKSCPTPCDPMNCSRPGFPVLHLLSELAQTHVRWVCDAIQPSRPLLSPSPPALNLSQQQGLFQWVSSSHQVAKVIGASASASVPPIQGWFSFRIDWFGFLHVQGASLVAQMVRGLATANYPSISFLPLSRNCIS